MSTANIIGEDLFRPVSIYKDLKPYLTEQSKLILENHYSEDSSDIQDFHKNKKIKIDERGLEISFFARNCNMVDNVLSEGEFVKFANSINKAVEEGFIEFGVLSTPICLFLEKIDKVEETDLTNIPKEINKERRRSGKVVLMLYAYSKYNVTFLKKQNDIFHNMEK